MNSHAEEIDYYRYPEHWSAAEIAASELVHGYRSPEGRRGAAALAPALGKSPSLLSNEVNADYAGAKLGLSDAIRLEHAAGDYRILHAHAQMLGHVCHPLPEPDPDMCDVELLNLFSEWQAALGRTCTRIREALDPDGEAGSRPSPRQAAAIHAAGQRHMMRFMEFLARVQFIAARD